MSLSVALRHDLPGFSLDVAFDAPPGVTVLFGRSGAGKTTIINAIAGLYAPREGRIVLNGRVLLDTWAGVSVPVHRRRLGYVFQEARLFPHLTVRQNLLYGTRFAGGRAGPDFDSVVRLLDIGTLVARRPGTLSGGERQRVAIGRAMLAGPDILLMDEPLASLDEARKAEILPFIERLRDQAGMPILYVSHSMPEVARLATTIVAIEAGRVVRSGPAHDVLSDPEAVPVLGVRDAGAILTARVVAHEADGLTRLLTGAGDVWLPRVAAEVGTVLRVRVGAQDVILSRTRPDGLSALNVLPATVAVVKHGAGGGTLVQLRLGGDHLLSRITRRSCEALQLVPGAEVFAIIKSVAVAQGDIGSGTSGQEPQA